MIGIYKITNKISGKFYIGRSNNVFDRIKAHIFSLKRGNHPNSFLQEDCSKIGIGNFGFEILEFCTLTELKMKEAIYIQKLKAEELGYNKEGYFVLPPTEVLKNARESLIKKSFKKITLKDPKITYLEEEAVEKMLAIFNNDIEMVREVDEIFIVPNKYKSLKSIPYIFLLEDIQE